MPRVLQSYVRVMDSATRRFGLGVQGLIFVIIGILLYETVARYIFDSPTLWSIEMSKFVFGAYFLLGGAYVLLTGGHVRMDVIYSRWPPRRKALIDAGLFVFFVIFVGFTLRSSIHHATVSTMMMQRSGTPWHPYLWPIKIVVAIGFLLMLLQGISQFIKYIATARGKPLS
ncbi:MAG: TRAP transporter small permease subunit [Dehalococcoidia bacterium]|nr:MAG: TRAP transporter small permease subunit [Dehalococcoidia bacterium]